MHAQGLVHPPRFGARPLATVWFFQTLSPHPFFSDSAPAAQIPLVALTKGGSALLAPPTSRRRQVREILPEMHASPAMQPPHTHLPTGLKNRTIVLPTQLYAHRMVVRLAGGLYAACHSDAHGKLGRLFAMNRGHPSFCSPTKSNQAPVSLTCHSHPLI